MHHLQATHAMIMDASVLIDFVKADRSILKFITKYVGPLYAIGPVADEVKDVNNPNELIELGVTIIEPHIDDALIAASLSGPTSFEDRLTMLTARRYGMICVTNDKPLRKLCRQERVSILWGLKLLSKLYKVGGITKKEVIRIAVLIHQNNPKHIPDNLLERFKEGLK